MRRRGQKKGRAAPFRTLWLAAKSADHAERLGCVARRPLGGVEPSRWQAAETPDGTRGETARTGFEAVFAACQRSRRKALRKGCRGNHAPARCPLPEREARRVLLRLRRVERIGLRVFAGVRPHRAYKVADLLRFAQCARKRIKRMRLKTLLKQRRNICGRHLLTSTAREAFAVSGYHS